MMRAYFLVSWIAFVEAKINSHLIFLTAGELGIPQNSVLTPTEMAKIRKLEAENAANFFRASLTILSFPDLHLPFIPLEKIIEQVMPIIREKKTDALFSFHPHETTPAFDHPDHNLAGLVSKYVGAAADVKHFLPKNQALTTRPELYLWTSKKDKTNLVIYKNKETEKKRSKYLIDHYPSQFRVSDQKNWKKIFASLTEAYEKVR